MAAVGENLRLARLRRKLTATQVAESAGITRPTLYAAERGDPAVSFGVYASVLSRTLKGWRGLAGLAQGRREKQKLNLGDPQSPGHHLVERIMTEEDVVRMIALEKNKRNHTLLRLGYVSGVRVSEL